MLQNIKSLCQQFFPQIQAGLLTAPSLTRECRWSILPSAWVFREDGANPSRTRRCNRGRKPQYVSHWLSNSEATLSKSGVFLDTPKGVPSLSKLGRRGE